MIQEEIDKLKKEAPTQRELDRAVNQYESGFIEALEKPGGFGGKADLLNEYYYYTGNPDYANENLARYKALSPNDIQAAALSFLSDNGKVILSIVPKGKTELSIQPKAEGK